MSRDVNLNNRVHALAALRREILGPDPQGVPALPGPRALLSQEEFRTPRRQPDGEEILWQDRPSKRYGAAVLFPIGTMEADPADAASVIPPDEVQTGTPDTGEGALDAAERIGSRTGKDDSGEDYDIGLANSFRPSAVGLSFVVDLRRSATLSVRIEHSGRMTRTEVVRHPCGIYRRHLVLVGSWERTLWLRRPVVNDDGSVPAESFTADELLDARSPLIRKLKGALEGMELTVVVRPCPDALHAGVRLLTVSLVNRRAASGHLDEQCLFQTGFSVTGESGSGCMLPYPERAGPPGREIAPADDESVNSLLYRHLQAFAVGHGCSADWEHGQPASTDAVWTEYMPVFETPATSADLEQRLDENSFESLAVSMRKLAGLIPGDTGDHELQRLVKAYEAWIAARAREAEQLDGTQRKTAEQLVRQCRDCLARIRKGMELLRDDPVAARAFELANHAMVLAQLSTASKARQPVFTDQFQVSWDPPFSPPDVAGGDPRRGFWRPFQIAFLLMSLCGIRDDDPDERNIVDLIWFPTGGGKTEAYLGLTAFTVFYGALRGDRPAGCTVLMRYTLRLLTAQQFQRAATLFCAMELLRKSVAGLGERAFTIGLWVGGTTTPNKRDEATTVLRALHKDASALNPFVLLRCPWCAAAFGPVADGAKKPKRVFGYTELPSPHGKTVKFRCGDPACPFGGNPLTKKGAASLPVCVIDEDLFAEPPDLLIGTVDKFALLAWEPAARRLFGLNEAGQHSASPPRLIIQDELHLISGPLGSMVGAYELAIETLCTRDGLRPKIVASTATISRAGEQVRSLYARSQMQLFPPPGLQAGDSFFAREAHERDGSLSPGRLYVGIMAPGHGSLQTTQVRSFSSLLQSAADLGVSAADADPWWTLLAFYNSIRELGGAATLLASDVREYLRVIGIRRGNASRTRRLMNVEELTSRIPNDEIPRILARLEQVIESVDPVTRRLSPAGVIDVCLASNIIEVGVDVPRLALMAVVGQPKTTSQYIQVTSRVGRSADRPGLVVVLYSQTKPRDRSHFERFRTYHQRLYAQVEPTSVTPFSPPAAERALPGVIAALVRQLGREHGEAESPDPFPLTGGSKLRQLVERAICERVSAVAPGEKPNVEAQLLRRLAEWEAWCPGAWGGFGSPEEDAPLLHPAGSVMLPAWNKHSWATLSSMRDVDASCEAEVTAWFNEVREIGE